MILFHWRPLIPGERDTELLWGSILCLADLIATVWLCSGLVPTPLCPFHCMTGIPCPTCGMTRGLCCLLHGEFVSGLLFNPLGMLLLMGSMVYFLYALIVVTGRLPRLRWKPLTNRSVTFLRWLAAFLIAGNWVYLVLHEKFLVALR